MPQKLVFVGLLLGISMTFSMAGLNMLIVSPLFSFSHHQFDMDMARVITREKKHKVHVFVPVREKEDCAKVNESAKGANFTVECYYKESTKKHWSKKEDGRTVGFPEFYEELFADHELLKKLKEQKFDVGLAQLHFFSRPALELYSKLGIKKHIGMLNSSLSPYILKLVGLLDKAIEYSVPPVFGKNIAKIGDSQHMPEERKNFIRQVYDTLKWVKIDEFTKNLAAIFINSRKELEWNNGEWMANPAMKLAFVGGLNLPKNLRKNVENTQQQKTGKKTVLISFGGVIDTRKEVTDEQIDAIKWAIQRFPQFNFIWKVSENEERLNKMKPIKDSKHIEIVKNWIDQRKLLAETNTVGFISHCGRNSELEAIVNGVSLICIPFNGDQFYNAEALAQKGASISIDLQNEKLGHEMANQLEKLLGKPKEKLPKEEEEIEIKKAHKNLLQNFNILHKSMNDAIEEDEMGKEIFGILAEIEKQLAQNPSD